MTADRPAGAIGRIRDRMQSAILGRIAYDDAGEGRTGTLSLFRAQAHRLNACDIAIEGWPEHAGLRIAVLADLHLGSHPGDVARMERIVQEVNDLEPDLVLLPGDFLNVLLFGGGRISPERIAGILSPLRSRFGSFAVLGNHDHHVDASRIEAALDAAGINVLENRRVSLSVANVAVELLGVPDAGTRPDTAMLDAIGEDSPAIVLTHDPALFARLAPGPHLMVCGHTHGGQIRLPILGLVTNMSRAPLRWSHGHVEEGGRHLFVSSGLGTTGIPVRYGVPPEIALLTITATAPRLSHRQDFM